MASSQTNSGFTLTRQTLTSQRRSRRHPDTGGERRKCHRKLRRLAGDDRPTDRVARYARVSSHSHKDNGDLDRQLDRRTDYAHNRGWRVENTYTDVGSGRNENRRRLGSLLDDLQDADYGRVLVTYEDRLTRFGFEYLERYFDCEGVTITVIEDRTDNTVQEALVASFSGNCCGMQTLEKEAVHNTVESDVKRDE